MHPAPSIILFTTLSGLGFGLLAFLGINMPGSTGFVAFVFFAIAYVLAVGGLLFSTFHLGHPERAVKAFSQWRSSWLSREAWLACGALITMGLYAFAAVFFSTRIAPLGWIGAALSLATIGATSMMYGQLKTVPRWHNFTTPVMFLTICIAGGALLASKVDIAIPLLALAGAAQIAHWVFGDKALASSGTTLATATGLGARGEVRAFEPPHTGTNYLLKEFVFVIGRKHAFKLRIIAIVLMAGVPLLLLLLSHSHVLAALAVLSHLIGVFAARWLFFAEAEHVVGLYYGKR